MKQLYITFLFAIVSSVAFAQQDFRNGYIIQNGDTTVGLLDYRGAQRNTLQVTFKTTAGTEAQSFTPEQVQGFGFNNERKFYESKLVPAFDSLSLPKTLFLEALVTGKASLYFLRDDMQKDHFYIAKDNSALTELRVEEFKQKNQKEGRKIGNTMLMRRELYKPVLFQTFLDCTTITEADIDNVVIGLNSLSSIVNKYNQCMGNEEYSKVPKRMRVAVGPVVGISASTLNFTIDDEEQNFDNTSVKPVVGASMNISFPTFSEKLSIQLEFLYAPNYFEGSFGDDPTKPGVSGSKTWIDVKHLKVPMQLRYTYPRGTFKPYFNVGPVWNLVISQKNETTETTTWGGTTRTTKEPMLDDKGFRKSAAGLTAGAGFSYSLFNRPFSLEARYEYNNGVSNFINHISKIKSMLLVVSYKL